MRFDYVSCVEFRRKIVLKVNLIGRGSTKMKMLKVNELFEYSKKNYMSYSIICLLNTI